MKRSRWPAVSDDPNSATAHDFRQREMDVPYREVSSRNDVILPVCTGRTVLDIGCVDHSDAGRQRTTFLHQEIRQVARRVCGLDIDAAGLASLPRGLDLCAADATGPGLPFRPGSFEVVVAGEVIEHLEDVGAFLRNLRDVVAPQGTVVLTTPNPFHPRRVSSARQHCAVENVDHTLMVFPGGMAELADRAGLQLTMMACTVLPRYSTELLYSVRALGAAFKRWLRGTRGRGRFRLPVPRDYVPPWEQLMQRRRGELRWRGETAIYVFSRSG